MKAAKEDILKLFPYSVRISDPSDMTKDALTQWEDANRAAEWRMPHDYAHRQSWSADPGGSWELASSKTYYFKSAQDAELFERRFD
ncbi:MAG: hypothetical protein U1E30_03650 [Rhodoblastus sp.]